ncbi:hypothetical protein PPL_05535 [Heterostelium album PN500]|uniref:Uncharacterized protein n=1 Tax=Heterostelium pallidum (strain ATCC 26659 / Pp 5 / PN500) TaxID=670386 RepID=D3BAF9_HETP5|nr:hypothetical protein PPL_05535 [Heterostelium album PN500]EFA81546.1 hypothetical protein PPL_05535 [Heterostelium album PN500]|eukprot:XP_020433663.1 hypothetical protein PPL_05535 [Heterostelium album PN500]
MNYISILFILSNILLSVQAILPVCDSGMKSYYFPTTAKNVLFAEITIVGWNGIFDIEIILSAGDTVLGGYGAGDSTTLSVNEYRGFSFVNGNTTNAWTIKNLFSLSIGSQFHGGSSNLLNGVRAPGVYYPSYDGLNGASKGNEENLNNQMNFLNNQAIRYYGSTNFQNKWKLLNIYIGIFKACSMCTSIDAEFQLNPVYWGSYYLEILNNITISFNHRTIINMIALPQLNQCNDTSSNCKIYNQNNNICPCLWTQSSTVLTGIINAANQGMRNAIQTWKSNVDQQTTTVGVIYQPFLVNTTFPASLLSPVDCFHPNSDGHKLMTVGLWNNLRQKSVKSGSVSTSDSLICEETFDSLYDETSPY